MGNKRVLLVNTNMMKPPIGPIGLDYIGESLAEKGYIVDLLDLCLLENWKEAIDRYFEHESPVATGITVRNTDDCYLASQDFFIPVIKDIVDYIKTKTDSPIIMGGVGFSIMPETILQYCGLELGIKGDGELVFPALLDRISQGRNYEDLPGLVYKRNGTFVSNLPEFVDLNRVPFRQRTLVDNLRYFNEGGQGNIETKRGCNRRCIYCVDPLAKGKKIRLMDPRKVVKELEILVEQGINSFHFCDSEFNLPEDHAKAICQEIINRGISKSIEWYVYCAPRPFSEELARLMKLAGCSGINFGVDNGNEKMLKQLGRDFGEQDIRNVAELCHRYGITCMFDLLLGGPGETRETIEETINLMRETEPDRVGVMVGIRIYPGTALAEIVRRQGSMEKNRNLRGTTDKNTNFFAPIFYVSGNLGEDIYIWIEKLIARDERFFFSSGKDQRKGYNYNQNQVLVEAIKKGYRGAYWDILRRVSLEGRNVTLRFHHLLCLYGFRGMGYSQDFVENMKMIREKLRKDPQVCIELVNGVDDICLKCPHNVRDKCTKLGDVEELDQLVSQKLKVGLGARMPVKRLLELVEEKIRPEDLCIICKGCEWFSLGACEEGLRKKNWWK